MMKNIMCICNTYYQLFMILQMKLKLWNNDNVTLIISDHVKNSKSIVDNINLLSIFKRVIYIETLKIDYKKNTNLNLIREVLEASIGHSKCIKKIFLEDEIYDEFFYYNYNVSTCLIFNILIKQNNKMICSRYEEGLLGYMSLNNLKMSNTGRLKYISWIRKIMNKKQLKNVTENYYCMYPTLYQGKYKVKKIPKIDIGDEYFKCLIRKIFNLEKKNIYCKQKYIFFTSVCDFEGGEPIKEVLLIEKIAKLVGKDNLLIKMHPRDRKNDFKKYGYIVDENSNLPWEAICINYNFNDKVFLTTVSGSLLFAATALSTGPKIYYLYKMCNTANNITAKNSIKSIEECLSSSSKRKIFSNICVADKLEDILN